MLGFSLHDETSVSESPEREIHVPPMRMASRNCETRCFITHLVNLRRYQLRCNIVAAISFVTTIVRLPQPQSVSV